MHSCGSESTLDGHSSFNHAAIMFVQTQFGGLCSVRAPLIGWTRAPRWSDHNYNLYHTYYM